MTTPSPRPTLSLSIAGLPVRLIFAPGASVSLLPPSFAPFKAAPSEAPALTVSFTGCPADPAGFTRLIDRTGSDMGCVELRADAAGRYLFLLTDTAGFTHTMLCAPLFTLCRASLRGDSPAVAAAVSSLVRLAFSQTVIRHGGISIHASAVASGADGRARIFLGASGTGKSTHARLWTDAIPGTRLINDDNPILRLTPGGPVVYGSPWSGKTPCYRAVSAPLAAIIRLRQAAADSLTPLSDTDAFAAILPSCSVIKTDTLLHPLLCDTIALLASTTPVALLHCTPRPEAALLAARFGAG